MGEERSAIRCERARGLDTGCWVALRPDTPLLVRYELDLFAGYSAEFAPGTSLDVGATYYAYPGNRDWAGPSDYSELSGRLAHDLGPDPAPATLPYAPDQQALGRDDNLYFTLDLASGVRNQPVTLSVSLGHNNDALGALAADRSSFDRSLRSNRVNRPDN